MKVLFNTFGCKTNQYDTALVGQTLEKAGFELTGELSKADWVVVNTCSVTRRAEDKACQWARKVAREYPEAKIAVIGCSVEVSAERLSSLPGVRILLGTEEKLRLGRALADAEKKDIETRKKPLEKSGKVRRTTRYTGTPPLREHRGRARAFVKIQEGCNNRCAYCIVPYTRGPSRSRELKKVIAEARALERAGHREIVLTGIHIGMYGNDLAGSGGLVYLLEKLLSGTSLTRFRLSSLEVGDLSGELIGLVARESRICRHLHIPLQHGSASVLERMGRSYSVQNYGMKIESLADRVPGLGLGTDVIVGFPDESEKEFRDCFNFISSLPFTYLHVFPYSPRPGTPAAAMFEGLPPKALVKERAGLMRELSETRKNVFLKSLISKRLSVVREKALASGLSVCRADNYAKVFFRGSPDRDSVFELTAERMYRDGLLGRLPDKDSSG
ncbi:MAG: tRNA (N(6)-L-threonylcarbamoyladenosine(37)-C(2))-methylthiotransferase MtaB [Gemmatimonadota bacterium]|nr:tRNA (N(6)-L-threonylcarbamoyladenosine(37)-C(2))-methylthiotransferase MtaB [Gemmatimonadota bacterium]